MRIGYILIFMISEQNKQLPMQKKWMFVLALGIFGVVVYCSFAYLLSLAWFKGDDYLFATHDVFSIHHVYGAIHAYLNRVSRIGEIMAYFLGVMNCRWQHWVFTPLFLVALPFVLIRLVSVRSEWYSARTLLAFWFIVFLALQSVFTDGYWRNFWCFAASTNYFWSTVIIFAFIPVFFPWKWDTVPQGGWRKWLNASLAFSLGVYSGWGSEAMTVTLLPLLTFWVVYLAVKIKEIPFRCWAGYLGFCLGAFFLFASPALRRRAAGGSETRALDVLSMTSEEISAFVQNLSPEKVNLLVDGTGCVNLHGIPILEHVYFLPYLVKEYWPCCDYPTWMLLAFVLLTLLFRPKNWKRSLFIAGGMYLVSWVCAVSYLGGVIPSTMSFLPPSFIVMAACVFLLVNMRCRFGLPITAVATAVVMATGLHLLLPSAIEAHHYKKYEQEKFAEIARQKEAGIKQIVLYRTWPKPPEDALGLICSMELGASPDRYPNSSARHYYGVEGISLRTELKCRESSKVEEQGLNSGFELEKKQGSE